MGRAAPRAGVWLGLLTVGLVVLVGCESGVGRDPKPARATARAQETRIADLQRRLDEQRPTLEALARTPPPATAVPVPFADRWGVEVRGPVERRKEVGVRGGLRPRVAEGLFLVVPIAVVNRGGASAFFAPARELVVVDSEDRAYDLDTDAASAAYALDFGLDPGRGALQPGVPYPDVLVFAVATEAEGFVLRSADGSLAVALGV